MIVLGFTFLWFGWLGFNGGSGLNSSIRAAYVLVNTNISASCGAITWVFIDYCLIKKWSAVGATSGALVGLVGITNLIPANTKRLLQRVDLSRYMPPFRSVLSRDWCAILRLD
jgi:ammonia channel protein AmtB